MAQPTFDHKMSDAEALMWRLEHDPFLSSTFGSVTVLDRPADARAFRERMLRAAYGVRRLRQRVQPALANLSPPAWVDDPNFDIDYHVRHISLPAPGTLRQLLDLASVLIADPFDRTRPLWQFYVVDGLAGGKGATIQKMHHTIADGEASLAISMQYLDLERNAPPPPPLDPGLMEQVNDEIDAANVLRDLTLAGLRVPLSFAKGFKDALTDPTHVPAAANTLRQTVEQLRDTDQPHSPLWTKRSLRRKILTVDTALEPVKAAAHRLGGTFNTAFLTAAAQAAGDYHRDHGTPTDSLVASMAISTRTKASGSNAFSLAKFVVPTGKMTVRQRFAAIAETTSAARSAGPALDGLATLVATLPTSVVTRVARQQSQSVDFATSNVRAAPFKMYVAGAALEATYPVGPLLGVAFNVTLVSYDGRLNLGLNVDTAAVEDTDGLERAIVKALRDVARAR